eukprot:TRINITY_DN7388_c0_g4_i1.p1 TRINITY_DN7388_c0_g4~~TRINITY_DN7388_c0_g4_i1.p1  ORF type:complete len:294 (+),score=115.53 TRINITY_DN7388_c0_g4_i1:49-930(+)
MASLNLPAPHDITLYLEERQTVPYTPVDMLWQVDRQSGVALATFNTPDSLNALQQVLLQEMLFITEQVKQDPDIKCVVWTGAGRAFCAGASLKPRKGKKPKIPKEIVKAYKAKNMWWVQAQDTVLKTPTLAFWDLPKISICAVNGLTVGGAVNIALANYHDFVLCSSEAKFKYPFANLGIVPELASSLVLPELIGYAKAKELLFLGEWFSPEDALRMGLVNSVHAPNEVLPAALKLAHRIGTHKQPFALGASKKLINGHMRDRVEQVLDAEQRGMIECFKRGCALNAPAKSKL